MLGRRRRRGSPSTAVFSLGIAGAMLPEMSIATISSSGTSSDAKCVIVCACPSSRNLERRLRQIADEPAVLVADRHRHLDDVDVDPFGVADRLGPHRVDEPLAALERGDGAHLVLRDRRPRVPLALERQPGQRARLPAVDEEGERGDPVWRVDRWRAAASGR